MNNTKHNVKRGQRGFNLIEVLFAVFILVFMSLMFAAVVPTTLRSVRTANYYNLAAMIAQRKLDQLLEPQIRYAKLTPVGLSGKVVSGAVAPSADACEWYDPVPSITSGTAPTGTNPATKTYQMVGYFTKLDGLRKFKTNGTSACDAKTSQNAFPGEDEVLGKLVIDGWQGKTASTTSASMLKATVSITWRINGREKSTYTVSTLIPRSDIL